MNQFIKDFLFFFLFFHLLSSSQSKKLYILNINKGDMPNDSSGVEIILSDENVLEKDDLSLKIKWLSPGWVGDFQPKRSNWIGMKKIKFNIFNPLDREKTMSFVVKDETSSRDRNSWGIIFFKVKPGMNSIEIGIDNLKTKDSSREINLGKIRQWHFSYCFFPEDEREEKNFEEWTIYLSNLRIESE